MYAYGFSARPAVSVSPSAIGITEEFHTSPVLLPRAFRAQEVTEPRSDITPSLSFDWASDVSASLTRQRSRWRGNSLISCAISDIIQLCLQLLISVPLRAGSGYIQRFPYPSPVSDRVFRSTDDYPMSYDVPNQSVTRSRCIAAMNASRKGISRQHLTGVTMRLYSY